MPELTSGIAICLWLLCTLAALFGCGYAVAGGLLARRFALQKPVKLLRSEPVSLLKPLYGAEPDLAQNLASFCRQRYDAPIQIVFGLQDPADEAAGIVRAVMAEFPDQDMHLVCSTDSHGENPKISNVINIMTSAHHSVVILSDSDIGVDPAYVKNIVAALQQPGVGLVTCLYRGRAVGGFWSKMAAAAVDQHFLPGVLVGVALGLAKPCFGSTIALRTETLDRIGGFAAFADTLADDYAIGKAVRDLGLGVVIAPFVVGHTFAEASFSELLAHELRWVRTIRLVDRTGYAGSVLTHPLPFALAALLLSGELSGFSNISVALAGLSLACRLFVSLQVARIPGGGAGTSWLSPVRDILSFMVFVASFWPGPVTWRGRRFAVRADGSLKHL